MAAEGDLRKLLKARVKAYGGEVRAVAWVGRRNAPDVLCLFTPESLYGTDINGTFGGDDWANLHPFIETKGVEPSAREAQLREHERMRDAGCVVLVILTEAELDKWLPPL